PSAAAQATVTVDALAGESVTARVAIAAPVTAALGLAVSATAVFAIRRAGPDAPAGRTPPKPAARTAQVSATAAWRRSETRRTRDGMTDRIGPFPAGSRLSSAMILKGPEDRRARSLKRTCWPGAGPPSALGLPPTVPATPA